MKAQVYRVVRSTARGPKRIPPGWTTDLQGTNESRDTPIDFMLIDREPDPFRRETPRHDDGRDSLRLVRSPPGAQINPRLHDRHGHHEHHQDREHAAQT